MAVSARLFLPESDFFRARKAFLGDFAGFLPSEPDFSVGSGDFLADSAGFLPDPAAFLPDPSDRSRLPIRTRSDFFFFLFLAPFPDAGFFAPDDPEPPEPPDDPVEPVEPVERDFSLSLLFKAIPFRSGGSPGPIWTFFRYFRQISPYFSAG